MHEITIIEMDDGADGNLTYLGKDLPADMDEIMKAAAGADVPKPYIAHSYSFRLNGLNGKITGPQKLEELNGFAGHLAELSEYERVKLEGAVALTGCRTISDCQTLMYNLDCFELTPNAGDYESLGRHMSEKVLADALKEIPPELMAHFSYELLGQLKFDDDRSVFVRGHLVRDTERPRSHLESIGDHLAYALKMRLCSDANPDGVWLKFPMPCDEEFPNDITKESSEVLVAMAALKVDSIDECRAVECVSEYSSLNRCLNAHAGLPLKDLLWKAQTFGYAEGELGANGRMPYKTFAAAMEYEDCSDIDMAVDITQNLRCYDFAPDAESYARNYLERKGVDQMLASCFDLKAIGEKLAEQSNARATAHGLIARNGNDFVFDYYQPKPTQQEQEMIEIRLFCPLEIKTDPDSILGEENGMAVNEFGYAVISNYTAADYEDKILEALQKEHMPEEGDKGLAHYLNDESLAAKVSYIWPTVENWRGELWGVMEIKATGELNQQEMKELTEWCLGQLSDGLGEGFEQRPVRTGQGDLYVSFWHSGGDYFLKPEQELKGMGPVSHEPEPEQGPEITMGGMQ